MTLMTKILAAAVAVFALLALGLGGYGWYEHAHNAALTTDLHTEQANNAALTQNLAASQASLSAYTAANRVTQDRASTNQKAVTHAIQAHPDWGSQPVPDDVYASLYGNRPGSQTKSARPDADSSVPGAGSAR